MRRLDPTDARVRLRPAGFRDRAEAPGRRHSSSSDMLDLLGSANLLWLLDPEAGHIESREEQQRQYCADENATYHGKGHRRPEYVAGNRYQAKTRSRGREHNRPQTMLRALHNGLPWAETLFAECFDLNHKDNGIADQDADEGDDAEDRHKTQRGAAKKQSQSDADHGQWRHRSDQEEPAETLQLEHQDGGHDEQHQRHHSGDGTL